MPRLVEGLHEIDYEVRFWALYLFPMRYRRLRGDLVYLWMILAGFTLRSCDQTRGYRLLLPKLNSKDLLHVVCLGEWPQFRSHSLHLWWKR